jgi:hypothetical protein
MDFNTAYLQKIMLLNWIIFVIPTLRNSSWIVSMIFTLNFECICTICYIQVTCSRTRFWELANGISGMIDARNMCYLPLTNRSSINCILILLLLLETREMGCWDWFRCMSDIHLFLTWLLNYCLFFIYRKNCTNISACLNILFLM